METFHTPSPIQVSIRIPSGDVTVDAVDGEETEVDLRDTGDELSREAVQQSRVELRGSELVIDVPRIRGGFLRGDADVLVRVRCPRGSSLDVQTRSADLAARGVFDRLDATSVSGDVFVDEARRSAVRTTSGDVRIERCDDVEGNTTSGDLQVLRIDGRAGLKSVSGDVRVGDLRGQLNGTTVSGDLVVEAVSEGDLKLQAVSGDVTVGIRRGSRLWVDARSMSGSTSSELDLEDGPADRSEDGPLVEVRANTISGDIHVRRAAAAPFAA